MFNPTQIVIEAFINELRLMYERNYTTLEPNYPGIISFVAQLEQIPVDFTHSLHA